MPPERPVVLAQQRLQLAAMSAAGVTLWPVHAAPVTSARPVSRRRRTRRGAIRAAGARAPTGSRCRGGATELAREQNRDWHPPHRTARLEVRRSAPRARAARCSSRLPHNSQSPAALLTSPASARRPSACDIDGRSAANELSEQAVGERQREAYSSVRCTRPQRAARCQSSSTRRTSSRASQEIARSTVRPRRWLSVRTSRAGGIGGPRPHRLRTRRRGARSGYGLEGSATLDSVCSIRSSRCATRRLQKAPLAELAVD